MSYSLLSFFLSKAKPHLRIVDILLDVTIFSIPYSYSNIHCPAPGKQFRLTETAGSDEVDMQHNFEKLCVHGNHVQRKYLFRTDPS